MNPQLKQDIIDTSEAIVNSIKETIYGMSHEEHLIVGIIVLLFLLAVHIYSTIQAKKRLRQKIEQHIAIFKRTFDFSKDSLLILSDKNKIIYANASVTKLFELQDKDIEQTFKRIPEVNFKSEWFFLDDFVEANRNNAMDRPFSSPQTVIKILNDKKYIVNINIYSTELEALKEKWNIVSIENVTKEIECEQQKLKHQLTKLPNQLQAYNDLPSLYSKVHQENFKLALVVMHFDSFARLRSIIGVDQSNEIIIKFTKFLESIAQSDKVSVYHMYDNHFLLTITEVKSIEKVKEFIDEIQNKLAFFYKMRDVNLHLTVSAGIAIYPESGGTRKMLDYAYKALAEAQKLGEGRVSVYLPDQNRRYDYDELTLHNDMQKGLDNGEFHVYYQPIIRVDTEEVIGSEALIRWIHSDYGLIPPDVFINLMEKTGFIVKLGKYILETVLKQQKRWEIFKFKQIQVSINVSMIEIGTGEFVQHVEKRLIHHNVDPKIIKFEITEGLAMQSGGKTEKYFDDLKKLGVGISLDDFGTGYTSFTYLKKFPADVIKLDKSLVDYVVTNEEDQRIVKGLIELGHNLGMKILIEGIEDRDMVELLRSYGCDYMQGYFFGKPLPTFEFQKLLRN